MLPNLAQFALISTLLMNWDGIRLRMEPISPELADELNKIAARLQSAKSPDEIANILDDLLDLTRGTAAYAYVQGLAGRSAIPDDFQCAGLRSARDIGRNSHTGQRCCSRTDSC